MATSTLTREAGHGAEKWAEPAGRAGLVARGVMYLLVSILSAQLATGRRRDEPADQRGALAELAEKPFGKAVLVALAVGFTCYAAWRLTRAVVGEEGVQPGAHGRLVDVGKAVIYGGLVVSTIALLRGRPADDPTQT